MFELMKIVGLSAVLSAGLVTASEVQPQAGSEPVAGKIYTDRVPEGEPAPARFMRAAYAAAPQDEARGGQGALEGKGDRLGQGQAACASQAWPHIAPECLGGAAGPARGSVRVITVEQRLDANTSALVRLPVSDTVRH
jgi:hypothetical protein